MQRSILKIKVIKLRKIGKTYSEICNLLNKNIPKSTLSSWCRNIIIADKHKLRIKKIMELNLETARGVAARSLRLRRQKYIEIIRKENVHLTDLIKGRNIEKIALAMLYLGEGSKGKRSSLVFGNSNPDIIRLFLTLLRHCYNIDESKFRCTVQCRADQDVLELECHWNKVTKISLRQFYKAQIDPRTVGRETKNKNYKGVCRIDYLSSRIFIDLIEAA